MPPSVTADAVVAIGGRRSEKKKGCVCWCRHHRRDGGAGGLQVKAGRGGGV